MGAFWIDGIIISTPAFLLGLLLFDQFAALGNWGRFVGFAVSVLYFGLLNSSLTGGQTVGKKAFRIRVLDGDNHAIGFGRSCLRAVILTLPFFLNGAPLPPHAPFWQFAIAGILIFALGGAIIYLILFNRRNLRSVHDLVTGTYVVRTDREVSLIKPPLWKGHFIVLGLLLALGAGLVVILFRLLPTGKIGELAGSYQALMQQPDVRVASVVEGATHFRPFGGTPTTTTHLQILARLKSRPRDYDRRANELFSLVLREYPDAENNMRIVLRLDYGFDLGIASGSVTRGFNFTPAEWRARLSEANKEP